MPDGYVSLALLPDEPATVRYDQRMHHHVRHTLAVGLPRETVLDRLTTAMLDGAAKIPDETDRRRWLSWHLWKMPHWLRPLPEEN